MKRDKILMCPPDHFTVDCAINPWMSGHESPLDIELAKSQWSELRIPPRKRIIVDTLDAGDFACNAVNVGDTVFLNKASDPPDAEIDRASAGSTGAGTG